MIGNSLRTRELRRACCGVEEPPVSPNRAFKSTLPGLVERLDDVHVEFLALAQREDILNDAGLVDWGRQCTLTHGLLPDSFDAYKKQRHRWAYGGFQILKKHWRRFLPGGSRLTREQKREFALGWLNWLGAESIGVAVAILNIVWVPVVAFLDIAVPDRILTAPIFVSFIVSVAHFVTLYRLRVRPRAGQMLGSVLAAMSVQWTVARAVGFGVVKDHLPFVRTSKGGMRHSTDFHAFWEAVLAGLLILGSFILVSTNYKEIREINIFAVVLLIQSVPFVAAVGLAVIERTRLNDFAYWRSLEAKVAELLPIMFAS